MKRIITAWRCAVGIGVLVLTGGSVCLPTVTHAASKAMTALSMLNRSARAGQSVNLGARLHSRTTPLSGKTLTISVNGTAVGTVTTDANGFGILKYTVPTTAGVGTQTVSISFAGDDAYAAGSGASTLTVLPPATALSIVNRSAKAGQSVSLTARLHSRATPLSGKTLTFAVNGTTVGTATTDATGAAVLKYTIPTSASSGTQAISISFAGDDAYAAGSGTGTLTVK